MNFRSQQLGDSAGELFLIFEKFKNLEDLGQ